MTPPSGLSNNGTSYGTYQQQPVQIRTRAGHRESMIFVLATISSLSAEASSTSTKYERSKKSMFSDEKKALNRRLRHIKQPTKEASTGIQRSAKRLKDVKPQAETQQPSDSFWNSRCRKMKKKAWKIERNKARKTKRATNPIWNSMERLPFATHREDSSTKEVTPKRHAPNWISRASTAPKIKKPIIYNEGRFLPTAEGWTVSKSEIKEPEPYQEKDSGTISTILSWLTGQ